MARETTAREMLASNFMEALLRAALILGDKRQTPPVREICILSMDTNAPNHRLCARCRIFMEPISKAPPEARVRIVYPESSRVVS